MQCPETAFGQERLVVRPVRWDEVERWDRLMEAHHYLGIRRLVGESLRYVAEEGGKWLALVGWGSAAFKCGPRDRGGVSKWRYADCVAGMYRSWSDVP